MTMYAVANGKGGVGKSTTAAELVVALRRAGRTVLGIDLDQQGNLSTRVGCTADTPITATAADVILGRASLIEAAVPAPAIAGAHIIVGTHELTSLDPSSVPDLPIGLRDDLRGPAVHWDDVVIDSPPSLDRLALTALVAADVVIATTDCEWDGVEQLQRLEVVVTNQVGRRMRPGARVDWIIVTKFESGPRRHAEVLRQLRETYGPAVVGPIRKSVRVGDAYNAAKPVSLFAPREGVAADYIEALGHIIRSTQQGETR